MRHRGGNYDWDRMRDDAPEEGGCLRFGVLLFGAVVFAALGASVLVFGIRTASSYAASVNYGGALKSSETRKFWGRRVRQYSYQNEFLVNLAALLVTAFGAWGTVRAQQAALGFGWREFKAQSAIAAGILLIILLLLVLSG